MERRGEAGEWGVEQRGMRLGRKEWMRMGGGIRMEVWGGLLVRTGTSSWRY